LLIYRIRNDYMTYGYLYISNDYNNCYIDIVDGLNEYPVFFHMFAQKGIYTLNEYWTKRWINERIIPYERQNINDILKNSNMKYYNDLLMIIKSKAKSSMDDNYLEEIKNVEKEIYIKKRKELLISDFIQIDDNNLIVFFNNGESKLFNYNEKINDIPFLYKFHNEIIFNQRIRFNYLELYYKGKSIPFSYNNLINYLNNNLLNAREVMDELSISKQSVYNLNKKEDIVVIKNNNYLKNNVTKIK